MLTTIKSRAHLGALAAALLATPTFAQQVYLLRDLAGHPGYPTAISADGSTVVGELWFSLSENHAFRWTHAEQFQPLMNNNVESVAAGVSADGSIIVGNMGTPEHPATDTQIFRWTSGGGAQPLDPFHDGSLAYLVANGGALDAEGLNFVGVSTHGGFRSDGFFSTDIISNPLTPEYGVTPLCISADGRVAGGELNERVIYSCDHPGCHCDGSICSGDEIRAFTWSTLGTTVLPHSFTDFLYALNGDGSAAVGYTAGLTGPISGTRWGDGATTYTMPNSSFVKATAISTDGTTVGGSYLDDAINRERAWIAPANGPAIDLHLYLQALGLDVSGWTFSVVTAISMDGLVLAGYGSFGSSAPTGFVVDLRKDTDGDGLYDDWETDGIPYLADGHVHRYVLAGANPLRKDIYVELDWMTGHRPIQNALDRVIAAFDQAPVAAPAAVGGLPGITLHVDVADAGFPERSYPNSWTNFREDKSQNFGTTDEQGSPDWASLKKAKEMAYRYCIFCKNLTDDGDAVLGLGELDDAQPAHGPRLGGNDFIVALGDYPLPPTVTMEDAQACTFMHELGHTLGLYHGGGDAFQNFNPNHYSCMNYMWSGTRPYAPPGHRVLLDYSRANAFQLTESALLESVGIGGSDPAIAIPYVVPRPHRQSPCPPNAPASQFGSCDVSLSADRCLRYARFAGPVDWNNDGIITGLLPMCADPNGDGLQSVLIGVNEWDLLAYNFRDSADYSDLAPPNSSPRCPTYAEELFYESMPPAPEPPPCTGVAPTANAPTPASGVSCLLYSTAFAADFAGAGPFTIRWRWQDTSITPSLWVDFNEGTMVRGTQVSGADTGELRISNASAADFHGSTVLISYRLTDACGLSADSPSSTLIVDCHPANDACTDAIPLADGVTVSGTNILATQDASTTCPGEGADVWYTYQPTTNGAANVTTCGSDLDTVLTVYTGACGSLTQLDCNDDSCGRGSSVTLATTAGQAYLIRVGGFAGNTGNFVIRAFALVPPANDACANAHFLADNAPVNGTNVSAVKDGDASCAGSGVDVWYAYRPQSAATVNVSLCGSSFDTVLTVFTGACGSLTEVACNDDHCGLSSGLTFPASAGQTYLIRVSGYNGRTGDFVVLAAGGGGTIPPTCGSADYNCDGDLGTDADIESFFSCLAGNCPQAPCLSTADFNGDGNLGTDGDIEAFFRVLAGGSC